MKKVLLVTSLILCQLAVAAPNKKVGSPTKAIAQDLGLTPSQVINCLVEGKEPPPPPTPSPKPMKAVNPLPVKGVKLADKKVNPQTVEPFVPTPPVRLNDYSLLSCIKKEKSTITQLQLDTVLRKNIPNIK